MKIKELRIGNYLYLDNTIIQVINIGNNSINIIIEKNTHKITSLIPFTKLKPIPITSKILKQLGFRVWMTETRLIYRDKKDFYVKRKTNDYFIYHFTDNKHYQLHKILYVHQLQNIMYYLLDIDLTLY